METVKFTHHDETPTTKEKSKEITTETAKETAKETTTETAKETTTEKKIKSPERTAYDIHFNDGHRIRQHRLIVKSLTGSTTAKKEVVDKWHEKMEEFSQHSLIVQTTELDSDDEEAS
jgi:hypothetical protein